ncbi:MurR/RpiR family transcriptional regulator [Erysipelothrix sp. HDW6C]|uniref:MurR/RpiR family transcriptional regulator n=1 Tax=Erysipelothrix sp. HDW6C TaxID=2714930 RepID=UPI00140DA759|nr:MurR/RpiR family transcriptional regulator [Erysipelothrix sp. HDW6C]QIK69872.1 MurR/RpiR family transcriptional regulator [Erysipelothrix sp. HDW6C]
MRKQMRVLDALENYRDEYTMTEIKLVDFIIKNPQKVVGMSIQSLAEQADSSPSAVSRLCKKIGVESFQTFKVMLSSELAKHSYKSADELLDISKPQEAKNELLRSAFMAMNQTTQDLEQNELDALAVVIHKSKVVFVCGDGFSSLAADNIVQKWARLGKVVFTVHDHGVDRVNMYSHREDAIFIAVSNSGNSSKILELLLFAKSIGFKTMGITRRGESRIARNSDYNLYTAPVSVEPTALTNSVYAQFMAIDLLYSTYVTKYNLLDHLVLSDRYQK